MAERERPTDFSISLGFGPKRQPDGFVATNSGHHGRIQKTGIPSSQEDIARYMPRRKCIYDNMLAIGALD